MAFAKLLCLASGHQAVIEPCPVADVFQVRISRVPVALMRKVTHPSRARWGCAVCDVVRRHQRGLVEHMLTAHFRTACLRDGFGQ